MLAIAIVAENVTALVPSRRYMIPTAGELTAQGSCHRNSINLAAAKMSNVKVRPLCLAFSAHSLSLNTPLYILEPKNGVFLYDAS